MFSICKNEDLMMHRMLDGAWHGKFQFMKRAISPSSRSLRSHLAFLLPLLGLFPTDSPAADTRNVWMENAAPVSGKRPNIIFILMDDAGPDSLGCYGSEQFAQTTPQIDKLAAKGLRFTRCFAGPMCTPSRCQLMTGQYPFRNGQVAAVGMYDYSASLNRPSTALILQKAGYYTIAAGKDVELVRSGNDEYIGQGTGFYWQAGEYRQQLPGKSIEKIAKPEGVYFPDILQKYVLDRLDVCAKKDKPFFIYYSMMNPHGLGGAKPYTQRTPDSDPADFNNDQALFRDNMEYIDKAVGEVVERLKQLSLLDNTLILIASDNGAIAANQSKMLDPASGTYRKIHGHKSDLREGNREGACLVPLIAYWPDQIRNPAVIKDVVDFTDLLTTYAELAGAKIPNEWTVDGHSFAGLLKGDPNWTPREWIYAQDGYQWYVRGPGYRLNVDGRLFDMTDAPFGMTETTALEHQALRASFQSVLDDFNPAEGITYESYQDQRLKNKEWVWKGREFKNLQQWLSYVSGDKADPDHDGVPNILERAFGWSPTRGGDILPTPKLGETTLQWVQEKAGPPVIVDRIPQVSPLVLSVHIPSDKNNPAWELSLPPIVNDCVRVSIESSADEKNWLLVATLGSDAATLKSEITGTDGVHVRLRAERVLEEMLEKQKTTENSPKTQEAE
jgi:arylsulfatase A-like enzyme